MRVLPTRSTRAEPSGLRLRGALRRRLAIAVVTASALMLGATPADASTSYPVTHTLAGGLVKSFDDPSASPGGVNVAGCQLTAVHPRPVVLVNGTFSNMIDDWSGLGPRLANLGYCVYATSIGGDPQSVIQSYGPVVASALKMKTFIDSVLSRTGATQVDLVGHSQGGLIAEYYVKLLGGAPKVHTVIGISPSTHGTTLDGLIVLAWLFPGANDLVGSACPACVDQEIGSTVVRAVGNGPIAQPGVKYTVIETLNETVVTPVGSSFIREPGVKNVYLQDYCPFDWTDHASLPYSYGVYGLVRNALDPAHARSVGCF
ncbi:MAG: lipase [Pseudonocardiales bacterium]|nr:MAG: lipase [Pseudonocardiales bacterium]